MGKNTAQTDMTNHLLNLDLTAGRSAAPVIVVCDEDPALLSKPHMALACDTSHYEIVHVANRAELFEYLLRNWDPFTGRAEVAVVVLKAPQSGTEGIDTIRLLRSMPETEAVPVLVLGRENCDRQIESWFAAGAQGYALHFGEDEEFSKYLRTGVDFWAGREATALRMTPISA